MKRLLAFFLFIALPICLLAQTQQTPAEPAHTSYIDLVMTVVTALSSIVAIWKHKTANDAQANETATKKIVQSLVIGIEAAVKLPEVQAAEGKLKATIQQKATEYGVQPLLHRLVQDLTEPAASAGATDSNK